MKNCHICGQPSGIYDICRECQKDLNENKVSKCAICGSYYITGTICECLKAKKQTEEQYKTKNTEPPKEQNIKVEVNHQEDSEGCGTWFAKGFGGGCGCFAAIAVVIGIIAIIIISEFI